MFVCLFDPHSLVHIRFVSNAVAALERAEEKKWREGFLLPGPPYKVVDVNAKNSDGDTPLHVASDAGRQVMMIALTSDVRYVTSGVC